MPWDAIAHFAPIASAAGVLCGVFVAIIQMIRNRRSQKQATAANLWSNYLKHAVEYPQFAYPAGFIEKFDFKAKTFEDDRVKFERYEWFLSEFLDSCNAILEDFDKRPERELLVKRNLRYHREYLSWRWRNKPDDDFLKLYGPKLVAMVKSIVAEDV